MIKRTSSTANERDLGSGIDPPQADHLIDASKDFHALDDLPIGQHRVDVLHACYCDCFLGRQMNIGV